MRRLLVLLFAALLGCAAFVSTASPAGAVDNPDYTAPPPSVPVQHPVPNLRQPTGSSSTRTSTAAVASPNRQRLAITGAETTQLVVVGGLLVAGGAAILLVRRRVA